MRASALVGGLVFGGLVAGGIAWALSGDGGGARPAFTRAVALPSSADEVLAVKHVICTCFRGGATGPRELVACALKQVYPDVPWPARNGDHASLFEVERFFSILAAELRAQPNEAARRVWCGDDTPTPPPPPEEPKPPQEPHNDDAVVCNYVSCDVAQLAKGKVAQPWPWPHRDVWPRARNVGTQLKAFGYNVGNLNAQSWSMVTNLAMSAAAKFQADYNLVRANWVELELNPGPSTQHALATDGLMGDSSMRALWDAFQWSQLRTWQSLVAQASKIA